MSFYTSLTGLNSATSQLAVTANNIANVGTSGFKRSRADFGDIFSTSPLQKSSSNIGQGVSLKQVSQEFSQGNISTSGNSLDLAITGDGFFPLKSPDGLQNIYTRNGAFMLNDQNNVVNASGQRLQAASVDSSGKADLNNLAVLTIPPKTSGQAKETKKIELGLNLPAESEVIASTILFDRSNPATYNKSTALTVYDSGGNGYLATVYYRKTSKASAGVPESKWDTYFYVGDTLVRPELLQATDKSGNKLYVNKYGTKASSADVNADGSKVVTPPSGKIEMYTLDEQNVSTRAVPAEAAYTPANLTNGLLSKLTPGQTLRFKINVDGQSEDQVISYTVKAEDSTPATLARNLETKVNNQLGSLSTVSDRRYGINVTFASGQFKFTSGKTGDNSTLAIKAISTTDAEAISAQTILGMTGLPKISTTGTLELANAVGAITGGTVGFKLNIGGQSLDQEFSYTIPSSVTTPTQLAAALQDLIKTRMENLSNVADQRENLTVTYDSTSKKLTLDASGITQSNKTIAVKAFNAWSNSQDILGMSEKIVTPSVTALRGQESLPAILYSGVFTGKALNEVTVDNKNNKFYVSADGIGANIELRTGTYSPADLAAELSAAINGNASPKDPAVVYPGIVKSDTGRKVLGVTVGFDTKTNRLMFKTATTGDEASILVSGSAEWNLDKTDIQTGQTSTWVKLVQKVENGAAQYISNGEQTQDPTDVTVGTEWWPVFLDRGELSFALDGKPVSPLVPMPYATAFLEGGKGALTLTIDFTQSTQYSSSFAVLSQSQDGAPEGDLMGLNIGVDGLVSATYSNGSQASLGKIVLANFSSPTGLRQIGDASYLASATSGIAKIGEAGSAGFGSIRAGATERANVDLTQELVDLITAQRNFQANAKAIETSSTMTQAIINLRS